MSADSTREWREFTKRLKSTVVEIIQDRGMTRRRADYFVRDGARGATEELGITRIKPHKSLDSVTYGFGAGVLHPEVATIWDEIDADGALGCDRRSCSGLVWRSPVRSCFIPRDESGRDCLEHCLDEVFDSAQRLWASCRTPELVVELGASAPLIPPYADWAAYSVYALTAGRPELAADNCERLFAAAFGASFRVPANRQASALAMKPRVQALLSLADRIFERVGYGPWLAEYRGG